MHRIPLLDGGGVPAIQDLAFTLNRYRAGPYTFATPDGLSSWSFTRASTKTALNSSGVVLSFASGVPAITDLGFLIEAASTNLTLSSQAIANATYWGVTGLTRSDNATTAPDRTLTGGQIQEDTSTGRHELGGDGVNNTASFTSGSSYTFSVFAKAGTGRYVQIVPPSAAFGSIFANFDVQAGVVGSLSSGSSSIQQLGNGWYRCIYTAAATASSSGPVLLALLQSATDGRRPSYTGTSANLYLWGLQTELGPASSYILTTSAAVTRAADVASLTGLSLPANGTLFAKATVGVLTSNTRLIGNTANTNTLLDIVAGGAPDTVGTFNGTTVLSGSVPLSVGSSLRAAVAWSASGRSLVGNGGTVASDANAIGTFAGLAIGSDAGADSFWNGFIQQIALYPSTYSAAQLQALTQ